jgi:ribosomal-protein-alanine N-acetyltransferase
MEQGAIKPARNAGWLTFMEGATQMSLPTLITPRLRLSSLFPEQSLRLAELADDPWVAAYTAGMPSPYTVDAASDFIARSALAAEREEDYVFGIHLHSNELIGVINLRPSIRHRSGHLGYWIGAAFRNQGFMTEAVQETMRFGFGTLELHRIHTACMAENQASARVLEKAGLEREGCSRQAFLKNGVFHDLLQFGAIGDVWQSAYLDSR